MDAQDLNPVDDELTFDRIKSHDLEIGDDETEGDVIFRLFGEFVNNDNTGTAESEQKHQWTQS